MAQYIRTTPIIDRHIMTINNVICRHIAEFGTSQRGSVAQDVLAQLRNFVEHIMLKFFANGRDIDNSYENICKAIEYVAARGNLRVLRRFHDYLQIVASHFTLDEENSERLMLKYYEYLLKTKKLMHDNYSLDILDNIADFPLNKDKTLQEYYEKIAAKVSLYSHRHADRSDKYYVQKIKPFFVSQRIYYEVTFTTANDYASKFDRVIAFTSLEISDNYAVKFSLANNHIEILGKTMPIVIITGWEVAIRDCEYKNFSRILRGRDVITGTAEQQGLSHFLTQTGYNLRELVSFSDEMFNAVKQNATQRAKSVVFFEDLELCREIIKRDCPGANIIRYLLYRMNNKIIKNSTKANKTQICQIFM